MTLDIAPITAISLARLREQLPKALPDKSSDGSTDDWGRVYVPQAHHSALQLNRMIVEGMRGCGKSFWTGVLANAELRQNLASAANDIELKADLTSIRRVVAIQLDKLAEALNPTFPGPTAVSELMAKGNLDAGTLWSVSLLRQFDVDPALGMPQDDDPYEPWASQLTWAASNTARVERAIELLDHRLTVSDQRTLVVIDALDCVANDFESIEKMATGLLRLMVRLRFAKSLRLKAFVREDILNRAGPSVVDGAKLLNNKVQLTWTQSDLYGLLFHTFAQRSSAFQSLYTNTTGYTWKYIDGRQFAQEIDSPKTQEAVWRRLVGAYMGSDARRGHTYPYIYNHLADGLGRVAPRSFLAAIRQSLLQTEVRHRDSGYSIHPSAIKDGVRAASQDRVEELETEYAWVSPALEAIRSARLTVPLSLDEARAIWIKPQTLAAIESPRPNSKIAWSINELPAQKIEKMIGVMLEIGVLKFRSTSKVERLEVPDIYRLGYKIGRKGGIATEQKSSAKT